MTSSIRTHHLITNAAVTSVSRRRCFDGAFRWRQSSRLSAGPLDDPILPEPISAALLITVWLEVRVLRGPPHILANAEISWQPPNGPQLAGIAAGGSVSAETNSVHEGISGELSLALGIPFPGNGDRRQQETRSNVSTVQSNPASDADATIRRKGRRAGPRPFRGVAAHRSPP